jgi:hypothetical protein
VSVYPAAALEERPRLFGALADVLSVRFRPVGGAVEAGSGPLVAFLGQTDEIGASGRCILFRDSPGEPRSSTVTFGETPGLDRRLRGRTLIDVESGTAPLLPQPGDEVFAVVANRPVWLRRTSEGRVADVVGSAPAELTTDEVLRDRLEPGSFVALLPLVHFLREICAAGAWRRPPARAAFVVDDPNLHWRSYGPLRYSELVEHAREHHYHLAVAMVPFDGWYAHGPTVDLFRESRDALSLCIHGNDHRLHELGRVSTSDEARRLLAQAVRRTAAFERRTGLAVARVMVPPFEACSPAVSNAMLEVGFEAASTTRPYPSLPLGPPHSSYVTPDASPTSGWSVAELTENGLPVLIRRQFDEHDDVVLRNYLGQPIILYGHVADLADGLQPLAVAAGIVNSLPSVTWQSLDAIAAGNFEWRRNEEMLELRPYARRLRVRVDADVSAIRLHPPPRRAGFGHGASVMGGRLDEAEEIIELPLHREEPIEVEIRWNPERELGPDEVPAPGLSPGAVSRRLLVEARDRLRPVLRRPRSMRTPI